MKYHISFVPFSCKQPTNHFYLVFLMDSRCRKLLSLMSQNIRIWWCQSRFMLNFYKTVLMMYTNPSRRIKPITFEQNHLVQKFRILKFYDTCQNAIKMIANIIVTNANHTNTTVKWGLLFSKLLCMKLESIYERTVEIFYIPRWSVCKFINTTVQTFLSSYMLFKPLGKTIWCALSKWSLLIDGFLWRICSSNNLQYD